MNKINSFTFYRDYFNLIDTIPLKNKEKILVAIVDYVFKDIKPKLSGHDKAIFNTLTHQLDKSKNRAKSARKKETIPDEWKDAKAEKASEDEIKQLEAGLDDIK